MLEEISIHGWSYRSILSNERSITLEDLDTKLFIFLLGLFLFVDYPLSAKNLQVCGNCKYQNLDDALYAGDPFDTIIVETGVYEAVNVELTYPLTLIGRNATLDGKGVGYVLKLLSDSVSISGFKIVNSGRSYTKDYAAVYAFKSDYFSIESLEIENPFFGLLIEKSKFGVVKDVHVYGNAFKEDDGGNGIHLWHCSDVTISHNEVHGLRDGIYLEFVDNSVISQNYSHHNVRYGLHFMFSNHDEYLDNKFESNGAGVAVMFSKFIQMRQNIFTNNWGSASYGLLLKEIYDAEVVDNEFLENTIAIFIDGTTRINYHENLFRRNGWAIKVSGGCYSNNVYRNNFEGNSFDLSYNSKINDNSFDGNYWGYYAGYDLDRDGIGDVPFRPVKLFSYIVNQTPETIVLMRSLFVDLINFSERVSPIFTPDNLVDNTPYMKPF